MNDDKYTSIVITPDAWNELYGLLQPFIKSLAKWGMDHDQPLSVAVGVAWGVADVVAETGDACDCEVCQEVSHRVANELVDRMVETIRAVRH